MARILHGKILSVPEEIALSMAVAARIDDAMMRAGGNDANNGYWMNVAIEARRLMGLLVRVKSITIEYWGE